MAEEYKLGEIVKPDILIKKCTTGFMVKGNIYASDELRAFSTPEGLIEWLSRELGAGPIVWALTLEVWREDLGISLSDLMPVPEPGVDPQGYQKAIIDNAYILLNRFLERREELRHPEPPPEPKLKKEKKVKEKSKEEKERLEKQDAEYRAFVVRALPKEEVKEEKGG